MLKKKIIGERKKSAHAIDKQGQRCERRTKLYRALKIKNIRYFIGIKRCKEVERSKNMS